MTDPARIIRCARCGKAMGLPDQEESGKTVCPECGWSPEHLPGGDWPEGGVPVSVVGALGGSGSLTLFLGIASLVGAGGGVFLSLVTTGLGRMLTALIIAAVNGVSGSLLLRIGLRTGRFTANPTTANMVAALEAQESFWRFGAIITMLAIILVALAVFGVLGDAIRWHHW